MTHALMIQGTGSDVGKSLLVAGLCRALKRRGVRVAPFKPQNMSNNAAVTQDGGEIGRAQWLQALAAEVTPSVHMNPVLLKPQSDRRSQVIVQGRVESIKEAAAYHIHRQTLMDKVLESYYTLAQSADMILVEGAGSPAEINLREGDIANMGFAAMVDCPVVLAGDIDRGGVIASIVGTKAVLTDEENTLICGFLINKFRGDPRLFDDGITAITNHTGWPCFGVIPYVSELRKLPQEDALALERSLSDDTHTGAGVSGKRLRIVMPVTPRLANFTDMDPLRGEPDVEIILLREGDVLPADIDLVVLVGTKTTIDDLAYIRAQGWDADIAAHYRRGGYVLGICGGYQMLGNTLSDPNGVEGAPRTVPGLGLLDVDTVFSLDKQLIPWQGILADTTIAASGYEIHMGRTYGDDCKRPLFTGTRGNDGAISADGRVIGTYIHGLFNEDSVRHTLLRRINNREASKYDYTRHIEEILDRWADHLEQSMDIDALLKHAAPLPKPQANPIAMRS